MAIRLASAIGQQREPIGILGGLDEAINRTGDAIQAANKEKRDAAAKKRDQEQRLKDAVIGSIDVTALEDVHPDDRAEDINFKKEQYAKIAIAAQDPNIRPAQLQQMQRDYIQGVKDREYAYKRDWKVAKELKKAADEGYLTKGMDMFIAGQTDQQNTAPKVSKSQEDGGIGVPTEEEALGSTEFTGTPYFKKPLEERLKTDIEGEFGKRVIKPVAGVKAAAKDVFSEELNPDAYVEKVVNKTGGYDFTVNKNAIERDAQRYAIQMVGDTNWGKSHKQTKDAMEYQAAIALRNAGLEGKELAAEMPKLVAKMAYDEYKNMAMRAADDRLKNQKEDPLRKEGKGLNINFNSAGGISKGAVSLDPIKQPSPTFIEAKYSPKIKKAEERIAELEAVKNPNKFQLDEIKAQKGLIESLKKGEGLEQGKHFKFSNKKSGDDAFITISPNNKRKTFRLEDITPTKDGFEISGVERTKDDNGNNIDTPVFYPLTLDIYTDIINENPDAVDVFNEAGIKPNKEKEPTKVSAPKEVNIGFSDYVKAYEKAKGKKATPEVIEKLKIKFQSK